MALSVSPSVRSWILVKNLHLLLLHALLLLADVVEAALQVVAALQRLLELGLHVDDLRGMKRAAAYYRGNRHAALKRFERTKRVSPPPRPFPSPGERSCSPSRSSGNPADWSAGTSTVGDTSEHLSSTQRQRSDAVTALRRRTSS